MIKPVLYIFCLFVVFHSRAQQNLIPNGSFEDTIFCPSGTNNPQALAAWYNPTAASPDYYHTCAGNNGGGVPWNDWGYQHAKDGNAYVGIVVYGSNMSSENYREYLQIRLSEVLKANEVYCWSAFISLLDSIDFASNKFGIALTNYPLLNLTSESLLPILATSHSDDTILDRNNWISIGNFFQAQGNEEYLTIGNFFDNQSTNSIEIAQNQIGGHAAYYYIDNIWLGKCNTIIQFPNIFTPNGDGVNEIFVPCVQGVSEFEWCVYNRWGNIVFKSSDLFTNWNGEFENKQCSEGVYYYVCTFKNEKLERQTKAGFFQLIR